MREIKFRVWDGKWFITDDFYINECGQVGEMTETSGYAYEPVSYVRFEDNWILNQFTGLKDKNGKEIYEGDILKMRDDEENIERIGFVDFGTGSFFINCGFITCYCWMDYETEIIGNIYENKNLLEE